MATLVTLIIGVAWPIAAMVVVCLFRKELSRVLTELGGLLGRAKSWKIGPAGAEFEPQRAPDNPGLLSGAAPLADPAAAAAAGSKAKPMEGVNPAFRPLVQEVIDRAKAQLPVARQRYSGTDEELFMHWAAEQTANLQLEKVSRIIFQSQIEALERLKGQAMPIKKDDFRKFYHKAAARYTNLYPKYTFEQWLGYLAASELIAYASADTVNVTNLGRVLAVYMAQRGYGAGVPG